MRKLIVALAMVVMCVGMTGCGEPYQNQYSNNSYDYVKNGYIPLNNASDIEKPSVAESYGEAMGGSPTKPSLLSENIIKNTQSSYSDNVLSSSISLHYDDNGRAKGFNLAISNKSKKDIRIIWNDSYFINNMNPDGGFMFDGIKYTDRDAPKQDGLIFPNGTFNKNIYPNSLVMFIRYDRYAEQLGLPSGWVHAVIKNGTHGAYLHIVGDGYDKHIKLLLNVQ